MLTLDGPSAVPEPGAVRLQGPEIAWIADNTRKFQVSQNGTLTIQSTRAFAETFFEAPVDEVAAQLVAAAGPWIGSNITQWQLQRWRYSKAVRFAGVPCVRLDTPTNLLLAGDYMQSPSRMEGALLSGVAAARSILSMQ